MSFARRLMKVAFTVFCVLILVGCRDLFVIGGIHMNFLIKHHRYLHDVMVMHIALKGLTFFLVSLMLTTATLYVMLRMHGWIDRTMARYENRQSRRR